MTDDSLIANHNIRIQKYVTLLAIILFAVKFYAWWITRSLAIYTDALEGIVNIISGFFGLYSLYYSAQPRDVKHPYGHGKVEFISAAVEGTFVTMAGVLIIFKVIASLKNGQQLEKLDIGIVLIIATGIVNYIAGMVAIRFGRRHNSLALVASGKHLQTDTYSTIGITLGLLIVTFTGYAFLDSIVALFVAVIIVISGIKIVREAIGGIMDEADPALIGELVAYLDANRRPNWLDLHNMRIIKYGRVLHIDAHMTVPWQLNVVEAHAEMKIMEELIREKYGSNVELFIHLDPSRENDPQICLLWTVENVTGNLRHAKLI